MTVYTNADAIVALLGMTLTATQEARATEAAIAASEWIERAIVYAQGTGGRLMRISKGNSHVGMLLPNAGTSCDS